jgi:hypothetical protein
MNEQMKELLYKSLDAQLNEHEQHLLDEALDQSAELRQEKERISELRHQISHGAKASFSAGFADRIMAKLYGQRELDLTAYLIKMFRPVAIAAAILITLSVSYNIWHSENLTLDAILATNDVAPEVAFNPLIDLAQE